MWKSWDLARVLPTASGPIPSGPQSATEDRAAVRVDFLLEPYLATAFSIPSYLVAFSFVAFVYTMKGDTSSTTTLTMTEPTPMQAAAIASGGGIWGDPAVELSTMGDQRQALRVKSLELTQGDLKLTSKKSSNAIVMGCIAFSTGIASFLAGVITIAIPIMAKDLHIPDNLVLW